MSSLVQGRHKPVLVDSSDDTIERLLASVVDANELFAKITEDVAEQAEGVSGDEVDALGVAIVANQDLVMQGNACENDGLVLVELGEILGETLHQN